MLICDLRTLQGHCVSMVLLLTLDIAICSNVDHVGSNDQTKRLRMRAKMRLLGCYLAFVVQSGGQWDWQWYSVMISAGFAAPVENCGLFFLLYLFAIPFWCDASVSSEFIFPLP